MQRGMGTLTQPLLGLSSLRPLSVREALMHVFHALALALCLTATAVHAQGVGGASPDSGRDAVGLCYSACLTQAMKDREAMDSWGASASSAYWSLWVAKRTVLDDFSTEDFDTYVLGPLAKAQRTQFCSAMRNAMRGMEGCRFACYDVERATGATASSAKNNFMAYYRQYKGYVTDNGLWIDHRTPVDFDAACDAFFGVGAEEQEQAAMPKALNLPQ